MNKGMKNKYQENNKKKTLSYLQLKFMGLGSLTVLGPLGMYALASSLMCCFEFEDHLTDLATKPCETSNSRSFREEQGCFNDYREDSKISNHLEYLASGKKFEESEIEELSLDKRRIGPIIGSSMWGVASYYGPRKEMGTSHFYRDEMTGTLINYNPETKQINNLIFPTSIDQITDGSYLSQDFIEEKLHVSIINYDLVDDETVYCYGTSRLSINWDSRTLFGISPGCCPDLSRQKLKAFGVLVGSYLGGNENEK